MKPAVDQHPSFTCFGELPAEIRLLIWEYCLPRRVAEIYDALFEQLSRDICEQRGFTYRPSLGVPLVPPLISRVCQEARAIALHSSCLQPMGISKAVLWFDKRTDAISIDPTITTSYTKHMRDANWSVLPRCLHDTAIPICIAARLVHHEVEFKRWQKRQSLPLLGYRSQTTPVEFAVATILQRPSCTVVLRRLALHLSHQDACQSGLFGLFAESSPAYVDVANTGKLQKVLAARSMEPEMDCDRRHGTWDLVDYGREGLSSYELYRRISNFREDFEELQSYIETKTGMYRKAGFNKMPGQEDDLEELYPKRTPQFSFVIAVYLCRCQTGTRTRYPCRDQFLDRWWNLGSWP
ncbi:hypothetical protein F5Y18DRAFT_443903 [Xylariaceae sp. FL1019]|nr:hypothetical protein F5Y18DRAFT_443903 [Xylariaceae sp. FL1019]